MIDQTYDRRFSPNFGLHRNLSIKTLVRGFKPRTLENIEFEGRQTHKNNCTFLALSAYYEEPVACEKIKIFNFEDHSAGRKLSIITLNEEVKTIVKEKYEFQYRVLLNLISIFGLFGLSGSRTRINVPDFC